MNKLTEKTYRKFINTINPENLLRGRGKYHLDHRYTVMEGFKNNIPPYILSHPYNLQMLEEKDNTAHILGIPVKVLVVNVEI